MHGSSAVISACGKYRYALTRPSEWRHPERDPALFVMLNPSTADATEDDATIRRCRAFARSWGCAGLVVVNLYAYRATDPSELKQCADPVGPDNDKWLASRSASHSPIVCAWGCNAEAKRVRDVVAILRRNGTHLMCLGTTKDGSPKHPLYLAANTQLVPWNGGQPLKVAA